MELHKAMSEVFGPSYGAIANTFRMMEVAEDEITKATKRWPDQAAAIWDSFRFMMPTDGLRSRGDNLYRAHCQELLERIATGLDLRPPTKAEKLGALSEVSYRFPLNNDLAFVYTRLFVDLFGEKDFLPEWALSSEIQQSYPGRRQEIEAELNRKLAAEWRK